MSKGLEALNRLCYVNGYDENIEIISKELKALEILKKEIVKIEIDLRDKNEQSFICMLGTIQTIDYDKAKLLKEVFDNV